MKGKTDTKDLRVFILIPVLANVFFLAGIPFYGDDMSAGLAIPLLLLPWGIAFVAGRLIEYITSARAPEDDAPEGFI